MGSHLVTDSNRLSIIRPDLSEEWSSKNKLLPSQVAVNCTKLVWWLCSKCGFEWEAKVTDRNFYRYHGKNGRTKIKNHPSFCPFCVSKTVLNTMLINYPTTKDGWVLATNLNYSQPDEELLLRYSQA